MEQKEHKIDFENIKDGTVNVVSMQLDNVLSILTKK